MAYCITTWHLAKLLRFAIGPALRYTLVNMKSITPQRQHSTQVLRRIAIALFVVLTVPWALHARDGADTAHAAHAAELRSAYFALAAEQRAEPGPDPERVAELLDDLRSIISEGVGDRNGVRFDSMIALREAARVALPHINAASGAHPTRPSEDVVAALRVLLDPAAARRVLVPESPAAGSDIDPLLELSFERLAVLYEQQSQLQRLEFARSVDVSPDRYRAVAAVTKVYAARSSADMAVPQSDERDLDLIMEDLLEQSSPLEAAVVVLASPDLRRAVAATHPATDPAADPATHPASPVLQAFTTGLNELYERVDQAIAEADLSQAGFTRPRVEVLRPTLGAGRLSESVIPYRRMLVLSGVAAGDGARGDGAQPEGARRQILPHEIAAELYYSVFYELSYELSHELREKLELPEHEYRRELWGRLHGQYVVRVPGPEAATFSLEERFAAELAPEFRLLAALTGTAAVEHLTPELNDSILRGASRHIERPLLRWNMPPELYLGAAFRQLHPARSPEQNLRAVRGILQELEQDTLGERRHLRAAAEHKRSGQRATDDTAADTAADNTAGERP